MPSLRTIYLAVLATVLALPADASQLVYQAVNPNFGGSPLNSTLLLQQATDNNHFLTNPNVSHQTNTNTAPNFGQQVRDALLSALESQAANIAVQSILGANGQAQNSGTVSIAGATIAFQRTNGQINITLTDTTNGGVTNISVPVPQY